MKTSVQGSGVTNKIATVNEGDMNRKMGLKHLLNAVTFYD